MDVQAKEMLRIEVEAQLHRLLDKIEELNYLLQVLFAEI
jgi:hypothetical protein